jgi:hypothetical protein
MLVLALLRSSPVAVAQVGNCHLPPDANKIYIGYTYAAYAHQRYLPACGNPPPFHPEDRYPCYAGYQLIFYYGVESGTRAPWLCRDDLTWTFGDGRTAPDMAINLPHTYSYPGIYTVTLTVNASNGTAVARKDVLIIPPPPPVPLSRAALSAIAAAIAVVAIGRLR